MEGTAINMTGKRYYQVSRKAAAKCCDLYFWSYFVGVEMKLVRYAQVNGAW